MDKKFQGQWIILHGISGVFAISTFALFANLHSEGNSNNVWLFSLLYLTVGLSGCQWWILRRIRRDLGGWQFTGLIALIISFLPFFLTALSSVFSVLIYPLVLSTAQWWILRRIVKHAYWWIVLNFIALILSSFLAAFLGVALDDLFVLSPAIVGAIAGGLWGLLYGIISAWGLKRLLRQEESISQNASPSRSQTPTPQTKLFQFVSLFLSFLLMFLWSFVMPPPNSESVSSLWLVILVVVFYPYFYLSILVHELGHLVAALLCGFKLRFIAVQRCALVRNSQGLRFQFLPKYAAGGITSTFPLSVEHLKRNLMLKIAAGPLASFLLFLPGVILIQFPQTTAQNPLLWSLAWLSCLNLGIAILNLLPLKFGVFQTDGRLILMLLRNTPGGLCLRSIYAYAAAQMQGIRPRDVNPETIAWGLAIEDRSLFQVSGLLIAYQHTLDAGEREKAGDYLDRALALKQMLPEFSRTALLLEGAYFYAHIRRDLEAARDWLATAKDFTLVESYTLHRVKAALALVAENYDEVLEHTREGMQQAKDSNFLRGSAIAELDLLQQIEREARGATERLI